MKTMIESLRDTQDKFLARGDTILIGEGCADPKAIFGSTAGLKEKYPERVFESPVSENAVTGVCIGAALNGMKAIHVHQRMDFMMYAMDQIINNAAKWWSMFGGKNGSVPIVIRCIIGRGWGQGNQHSQNLGYMFSGMPGLKVVYPSNADNARGLLEAAHDDPNPVIFIEHRWCHNLKSKVTDKKYELGKARIARVGKDITIVACGYMVIEAMRAAEFLSEYVDCEVIDLQTTSPIDYDTIQNSVVKTGKIIVVDDTWASASILKQISRLGFVNGWNTNYDTYAPATHGLIDGYYPTAHSIANLLMIDFERKDEIISPLKSEHPDIPDQSFKGPF